MLLTLLACATEEAPSTPGKPPGPPPPGPAAAARPPEPADPKSFTSGGKGGPNILVLTLDTVSADHLAGWGGRVATPVIDSLGGVRVKKAYAHYPQTAHSHWSLFSGVLPEVHGNIPASGASAYAGPSLAEIAAARGYATAAFVSGVTLLDGSCGLSRGFDLYDDELAPGKPERPAAETVAAATAWLEKQEGPWFLWVHLFDAHLPYTPKDPRRYDADYTGTLDGSEAALDPYREGRGVPAARDLEHVIALYDAEIAEMDEALAPLVAKVGGTDIALVTADHGESFAHNYLFNHRSVLWDDVMHVPMWVRAPGLPSGEVEGIVSLIDVAPTLVELAGWGATAPFQGSSRVGLLNGRGGGAERSWSRTDPWIPEMPGTPGPRLAEHTPTTSLIREADGSACRYDLVSDPEEQKGDCSVSGAELWTAYQDALGSMSSQQREVKGTGMGMAPGAMLESLGYVDPGKHPPAGGHPPGGHPQGPPGPPPQGAMPQGPPGPPPGPAAGPPTGVTTSP